MVTMKAEVLGLPRSRTLTRADLDEMPEDGHRYELIDGTLIVSAAPRPVHQMVCHRLSVILDPVVPTGSCVLAAPLDVVLSEDTIIQPDLLVAPRSAFSDRDLPVAPSLAVEVLSPSTRGVDLLLKKERLERAGCPHYWVVDPEEPSIWAWQLSKGVYIEAAHCVGEERFTTTEPVVVSFTPAELLR